jgi:hypothetical protein
MSRFTIADLSFCETEINDSEKVRGGYSSADYLVSYFSDRKDFYSPSANSGFKLAERLLAKYGYEVSYSPDGAKGDFTVVKSKAYGNGKTYSQASSSYGYKGKAASAKSYAAA